MSLLEDLNLDPETFVSSNGMVTGTSDDEFLVCLLSDDVNIFWGSNDYEGLKLIYKDLLEVLNYIEERDGLPASRP